MSELIQPVTQGKIAGQTTTTASTSTTSSSSSTNKTPSSSLDKNSFLKLLCTQMQYQDPLNPSSNTEYVAQLATFSELEQMQNLVSNSTNSQAFSLVGKNVTVSKDDSDTSNSSTVNGIVDFVSLSNGKAKISVNGSLYSIDQLVSVSDESYIKAQNLPGLSSKVSLTYNAAAPKDMTFSVNMGSGNYTAKNVGIAINGTVVDNNLIKVSKGVVTVDKSAFASLPNGTYKITVAFDNTEYTTVADKVTLTVSNSDVTNVSSTSNSTSSGANSNTSGTDSTSSASDSKDAVTV